LHQTQQAWCNKALLSKEQNRKCAIQHREVVTWASTEKPKSPQTQPENDNQPNRHVLPIRGDAVGFFGNFNFSQNAACRLLLQAKIDAKLIVAIRSTSFELYPVSERAISVCWTLRKDIFGKLLRRILPDEWTAYPKGESGAQVC
jgi:hypothetical protein